MQQLKEIDLIKMTQKQISQPLKYSYKVDPDAVMHREEQRNHQLKLFVANIPKHWDQQQLKKHFSTYGQIIQTKVVRKSQKSTGSGLVKFASMCRGEYAVNKMKKTVIPGQKQPVSIRWADFQSDRLLIDQYLSPKIQITGLPKNIKVQAIHELFTQYGQIQAIQLWPSRGCAQILYRYRQSVLMSMKQLDGKAILNSQYPVQIKNQKRKQNQKLRETEQRLVKFYWEIIVNSNNLKYFYDFQTGLTQYERPPIDSVIMRSDGAFYVEVQGKATLQNQYEVIRSQGPPGANLIVYHLPPSINNAGLNNLFKQYGQVVSARVIVKDGKSMGYGQISYDSASSAQLALKKVNRLDVQGRLLKVQIKHGQQISPGSYTSLRQYDINPL